MASQTKLDRFDMKIINALQQDARLSSAELAERVSLTASPCWRRVKVLEETGVITGYHAKVNSASLGYAVTAFVFLSLERLDKRHLEEFEKAVLGLSNVLSCHRVSGRFDYQLLVIAEDLNLYGTYSMDYINSLPHVKEMYTSFVLHEIKGQVAAPVLAA